MADTPTHKGEYAGDLWPPGYYDATHYWLDGAWHELPLSMEQNMRLMASEIERLRAALLAWNDAIKISATLEGLHYSVSSELAKNARILTIAALEDRT